jgi:PhnB protein
MATMNLNPYLNFNGNTREAMQFYHAALGGDLKLVTFGEFGGEMPAEVKDQIMHSTLTNGDMTLMASEVRPGQQVKFGENMTISLSGDEGDKLTSAFEKLSTGGTVTMPLEKQMWGDVFGMLTDQFGVQWMVNIVAGK